MEKDAKNLFLRGEKALAVRVGKGKLSARPILYAYFESDTTYWFVWDTDVELEEEEIKVLQRPTLQSLRALVGIVYCYAPSQRLMKC